MTLPAWARGREESEVRLEVEDYIQALDDTAEARKWLRRLRQRIDEREREIRAALHAEAAARYWKEEASTWTVGLRVWCNASGFFLGGNVQRGTDRKVVYIQKRIRRVWLAPVGKTTDRKAWHWYSAAGLLRFDFRRIPPENPVPEAEREHLKQMGDVFAEALR